MNVNDEGAGGKSLVDRWLAAARDTVAKVNLCWLVTVGCGGDPNARLVSPVAGIAGDDEWTIWFLTSNGLRKVADIRRDDHTMIGYQHDPDSAYVALAGRANIVEDRSEITPRWEKSWNLVFPDGASDPDAVFIRSEVNRIEPWNLAHKVTPTPFGKCAAVLARDAIGRWTCDK